MWQYICDQETKKVGKQQIVFKSTMYPGHAHSSRRNQVEITYNIVINLNNYKRSFFLQP